MLIVAVTGASGHIGNCLVRELIKSGARVKVLVHDFENDLADLDLEIFHGDILNPESLKPWCAGADVVFHCAAIISIDSRNPEKVYETNVTGTKNVVDAAIASGVKKLIHFSSIDAFKRMPVHQLLDENVPVTTSKNPMYDYSKAQSEKVVLDAVNRGLDAVILCPAAVVGPFDFRGSFLGQALIKIYRNKIPMLIPGGYNWVDVRDVVHAAIQAVESGRKGEKYIVSGSFYSLLDLSRLISKISGKRTPQLLAPVFLAKLVSPFYEYFLRITKQKPMYTSQTLELLIHAPENISNEKAQKELDYRPRSLDQTLRDTLQWYKQNKFID